MDTERRCICREGIAEAKERRRGRSSQPWIMLKFSVGFTIGIIGYTTYVYVVRLCVPMIRRESGAFGSRVLGIIFLAVFSILLIMVIWSYAKVVFTKPGFARDHVSKSEKPFFSAQQYWGTPGSPKDEVGSPPQPQQATEESASQLVVETPKEAEASPRKLGKLKSVPKVPATQKPRSAHTRHPSQGRRNSLDANHDHSRTPHQSYSPKSVTQSIVTPPPPPVVHATKHERTASSHEATNSDYVWQNSRRPALTPVLLPEHRYCSRDQLVKPFRTHHCRACGTCILKYDHHCPWIGQCVGARNQKFFLNFLEWSVPFCFCVFGTTLALNVKENKKSVVDFDPQIIVIIVLGGVFGLFTVMMLLNHVRLILLNQTTIESLQARYMKERDIIKLSNLHPWYNISAKRRTKRQWDEEWGDLNTEGNLWWLGSMQANWEDVMGRNPWWWFLPIGHSASDGLTYERNARFDESGRWRPRRDWPPELR